MPVINTGFDIAMQDARDFEGDLGGGRWTITKQTRKIWRTCCTVNAGVFFPIAAVVIEGTTRPTAITSYDDANRSNCALRNDANLLRPWLLEAFARCDGVGYVL